jgi:hypothetical protein
MAEDKSVEALRAELELQKAELKKLRDQVNPPPRPPYVHQPPDYTAGMSMGPSAMKAMIDALPASFYADLRADARKPNPVTQASSSPLSTTPSTQPQPTQRGTGWREEAPLGPPPGIKYVDELVDQQDKIDRAELAMLLAKASLGKGEGQA